MNHKVRMMLLHVADNIPNSGNVGDLRRMAQSPEVVRVFAAYLRRIERENMSETCRNCGCQEIGRE